MHAPEWTACIPEGIKLLPTNEVSIAQRDTVKVSVCICCGQFVRKLVRRLVAGTFYILFRVSECPSKKHERKRCASLDGALN